MRLYTKNEYMNKISEISYLSVNAFAVFTELERLDKKTLSISDIFTRINAKEDFDEHKEKEGQLIKNYIVETESAFNAIFPGHVCSMVMYFMPGTREPLPLYFGGSHNWDDNWAGHIDNSKKWAVGRMNSISEALRRSRIPKIDEHATEYENEHFFFAVYLHSKIIASAFRRGTTSFLENHNKGIGFKGGTVWADTSLTGNFDLILEKCSETGEDIKITWKREPTDKILPPMVVSPIFVNENTFIAMASFFDETNFQATEKYINDFNNFLHLHGVFSRSLFGPFYNAILRGDMAALRQNLERSHISLSLLDEAAKYLDEKDGKFTYLWEDKRLLNCADLQADIFGNVLSNPENIFTRVLNLEEFVYRQLTIEAKPFSKTLNFSFPEHMPLSDLLLGIEQTQRALRTKNRDHIIHQFQVFLLGTLIIRKCESPILEAFSRSLEDAFPEKIDKDSPTCLFLLKLAWFFCSTLHDIGYPVQYVDNVVEELRRSVANLLDLEDFYNQTPPRFQIERILYDDPRTYLLLREITHQMASWLNESDYESKWWYFIKHLTFNVKHHALASVIAISLNLIPKKSDDEKILLFFQQGFGKFLIKHVLIPIIFHHAYEWSEIIEKKILQPYKEPAKDGKKRSDDKQEKIILITSVTDHIKRYLDKSKLDFNMFPMACLLTLCDAFQESGRPGGDKESNWPIDIKDAVVFGSRPTDAAFRPMVMSLDLCYDNKRDADHHDKCKEDYQKKVKKFETLEKIFDLSLVKNSVNINISPSYGDEGKSGTWGIWKF